MKNILVVSGHPNPSASLANKTILESLRTALRRPNSANSLHS